MAKIMKYSVIAVLEVLAESADQATSSVRTHLESLATVAEIVKVESDDDPEPIVVQ